MFTRIDFFTTSGSSCPSKMFILFMGFLLSGWRMSFNGTRANTISEALATSVYHTLTSTKRRNSMHEAYKRKQGLHKHRSYDYDDDLFFRRHHRHSSQRSWSLHLRGGADATATTATSKNPTTTTTTGSTLYSLRDTIENSGHEQHEKDDDVASDDERVSSSAGLQTVNTRVIEPITTSIVIRERMNGSSSSFLSTNESIHTTFIPKTSTDIRIDRNGYKNKEVEEEEQDDEQQQQQQEEEEVQMLSTMEQDPITPCTYIAETNLPTDIGMFRLRAYRVNNELDFLKLEKNKFFGTEPCVIYSLDKSPLGIHEEGELKSELDDAIPVRIHDQCVTSEVFRSKRCDCNDQLKMALKYIQDHGGAIIYLQQEGRGIGLANKVAAYELQDYGMDTVDANIHLGFPEDCRQYGVVPAILHDMGIKRVKLMTNNPRKVDRLKALGVDVVATIPMVVAKSNPYNVKYLQTKKDRMNHANFGEILHSSLITTDDPLTQESQNILMNTRKPQKNAAEMYINDGEEMAAAAVAAALDDDSMVGVTASGDGYCFGRNSVENAIDAVRRGELIVVVDDMNRENEGDFIMAADLATPETIATIVRYSSGVICVAMEGQRMDELQLPAMVQNNEDPKGTAFSITVDAAKKHGISTGISARDRAKTLKLLSDPSTKADDFLRPGHIFPLRAREGGVLVRDGHTEAAIDLSRMAGCNPCGVLCEIVSEENPAEMARLPELKKFCKKHGYVLTSIVDIAQYRRDIERR